MSDFGNKDEFESVGDAIRKMLNSYRIDSRFDEAALVSSWERLVGEPIAKRTQKVFIRNRVLYVEFKTAAMKNDFLLHKPKVLAIFQREFGAEVVKDLVIL